MKPLLLSVVCLFLTFSLPSKLAAQTPKQEIDAAKILWHSHANAVKYFGNPVKILPPRIPAEGWDYEFRRGCGTVETKERVLLFVYRYKKTPKGVQEALERVGLPVNIPPVDFGTSYMWNSAGWHPRPMWFKGKMLNRVILAKDFSEISVDGHEPGTY
ncbi:MAG: hypothetical protein MUP80_06810 [Acidobacteriia bacterium]|nr:hypothetical protein [Terriglobia bacterium]